MRKLKLVPLEERIVLDAAIAHAADSAAATSAPPVNILVVSNHLADSAAIVEAANPNTTVITYTPEHTTLAELADVIAQAANGGKVDSIAFATEGVAGGFYLTDNQWVAPAYLTGETYNAGMVNFWKSVGGNLAPGGNIALLGCTVGANNAGEQLISSLESILNDTGTNISVFASTDNTGSTALGGNWTLEIGNMDAAAAYFTNGIGSWNHLMGIGDTTTVAQYWDFDNSQFTYAPFIVTPNLSDLISSNPDFFTNSKAIHLPDQTFYWTRPDGTTNYTINYLNGSWYPIDNQGFGNTADPGLSDAGHNLNFTMITEFSFIATSDTVVWVGAVDDVVRFYLNGELVTSQGSGGSNPPVTSIRTFSVEAGEFYTMTLVYQEVGTNGGWLAQFAGTFSSLLMNAPTTGTVTYSDTPTPDHITSEGGDTASFIARLTTEPATPVTITFTSSDSGEGTATTVVLDSTNWNTGVVVTVNGVNDFVQDGPQNFTLTGVMTSDDTRFNGQSVAVPIVFTNLDNDTAGVIVSPVSGNTTEAGGTASFTVRLNSQPVLPVTFTFTSSDPTEGTLVNNTITFDSSNWNTAQTVTIQGMDDFVDDGNITYNITGIATSSDPLYSGMTITPVTLQNIDNDTAGLTISPISGNTTEAGGNATFTVHLDSQPVSPVTITFTSSDPTEGTLVTSSVTFDASNWNTNQTVIVHGVDDFVDDGNITYTILGTVTSSDPLYNGMPFTPVSVTNTDNDTAGLVVSPISGNTTEAGGAATFTVRLDSEPVSPVTITFASSDATEGAVTGGQTLIFDASNWNTLQTVTITGVNDFVDDGDIAYQITGNVTSSDPLYNGMLFTPVSLANTDDDTAGVTISPILGNTTEAGGTATFTVVLDSEPVSPVTFNFSSSDATEGIVTGGGTITFDASNWNTAQTVTITGVNDFVDDGNITYSILGIATSSDPLYNNMPVTPVTVVNINDDFAGFTISPVSGDTTEAGGTATYTITLNSEPVNPVTILVTSSDPSEGVVTEGQILTFDASNWNAPQTVTITGVNDFVDDGDITYTIVEVATSTDPKYDNLPIPSVTLSNTDDDTAGYVIIPPSGNLQEGDPNAGTVGIVLTSEPVNPVTITVTNPDPTRLDLGPTSVTFDNTNWNTPQEINIGTLDDMLVNDTLNFTLPLTLTTEDPVYSITPVPSVDIAVDNTTRYAAAPDTPIPSNPSNPTDDGGYSYDNDGPFGGNDPFGSHTFGADDPFGNNLGGVSEVLYGYGFGARPGYGLSLNDNWMMGLDRGIGGNIRYFDHMLRSFVGSSVGEGSLFYADPSIIIVDATDLQGYEGEDAKVFRVNLSNVPTTDVILRVQTSDPNIQPSQGQELHFTTENWNMPQEIRLENADLMKHKAGEPLYLDISPAASGDAEYNGLRPGRVLIKQDNHTAALNNDQGFMLLYTEHDVTGDADIVIEEAARELPSHKGAFADVIDEYEIASLL